MKRFLKLFSVLLVVVMMTGCVRYNINMTISNNKKMKFEAIVAMQSSMMEGGTESTDEEGIKELEKKGFKVEEYNQDGYKGWKISKSYDNIDKLSSKDAVKVDLNKFLSGEEPEYFFQKDGKTYKAVFTFDLNTGTTDEPNAEPTEDPTDSTDTIGATDPTDTVDATDPTDTVDTTDTEDTDDDDDYYSSLDDEIDYSGLYSMMDIKYTVTVPKAGKNNATSTDKNKLTWDLTKLNGDIEFEFEIDETANLIKYAAIAAGVVVVLVVILLVVKKGKKTPTEPAVTDTPVTPVPEVPTVPTEPVAEPAAPVEETPAETPAEAPAENTTPTE